MNTDILQKMKTAVIERNMPSQLVGVNRLMKFHMEETLFGNLEYKNWGV